MGDKLPPRRSNALRVHMRELGHAPVRRYVDIQRERRQLYAIGRVDVDLEQLVARPFLCDRHRCVQWTPHERRAEARPLIDNSCCARYTVPVTDLDRRKLAEILPRVRRRLGPSHPLVAEREAPPYAVDEDFAFIMHELGGAVPPGLSGACQFVIYEAGQTHCAIHRTCLEEGLDVWEYKPLGCSLWPLALLDYDADGHERFLLTVYARATAGLFAVGDAEQNDEAHFACLVDQDPAYDPLYRSMEGIIRYALGADFYSKLDRRAEKYLAGRGRG
jgi:hypothetical protein